MVATACSALNTNTAGSPPAKFWGAALDALVYREYLDPAYTIPNTAPIIAADGNEPPWNRRVPGAVLYAKPGEHLHIHVRNADPADCHSFHLHGLHYGIGSNGAWPFGVRAHDGRRSDEILPGQSWTYVFEPTDETIGPWVFHDHVRRVGSNINRGLFGGLIVRDARAAGVDHEIPLFVHQLAQFPCCFQIETMLQLVELSPFLVSTAGAGQR
jgi:FtsP/CotA-like multicopper oxidase with cupredoxin domain